MKIDIEGTELEDKTFRKIELRRSAEDWMICEVGDHRFEGMSSFGNVYEIFRTFSVWAKQNLKGPKGRYLKLLQNREIAFKVSDDFTWLQEWFNIHCDGKWELHKRIQLETSGPDWFLSICIKDTELQARDFRVIKIYKSERDWISCEVNDHRFEGRGGAINLPDLLKVFKNWTRS